MTAHDQARITGAGIQAALKRVLGYPQFKKSKRLTRFLSYVVTEKLAGREDRLKGYAIGVEVFDKPDSFDPERDSGVRVEAVRLRRALKSYYLSEGRNDPIIIDIPKGSYVPVFTPHTVATHEETKPVDAVPASAGLRQTVAYLAIFGLLLLSVAAGAFWLGRQSNVAHTHTTNGLEKALKYPSGPAIAVLPFTAMDMGKEIQVARAFSIQLISDLTRFQEIVVVGAATTSIYFGEITDLQPIGNKYGVRYILAGILQLEGEHLRVVARLYDAAEQRYIWTTTLKKYFNQTHILQAQSDISAKVAATIGQPHGVISRAESRRLAENPPKTMNAYHCLLSFHDYEADKRPDRHAEVGTCLEKTVQDDPDDSSAWAALTLIYVDEARLGFNPRELEDPPLERALSAARRAVRIAPFNPTGHQYMALALLLNGDKIGARQHLDNALALNPNDAELLASAAWTYSLLEEWDLGLKLIKKALWLNPGQPPSYSGVLFAYHYRLGFFDRALTHALAYYQSDVALSHVMLAAVYGSLRETDHAARAVAELVERFPDFAQAPEQSLKSWGFPDTFVEQCLNGLRLAGLNSSF